MKIAPPARLMSSRKQLSVGAFPFRPGRLAGQQLTNENCLREVMNTVGKRGKAGRAKSSAWYLLSMLPEGWDAKHSDSYSMGGRGTSETHACLWRAGRGAGAFRRMSLHACYQRWGGRTPLKLIRTRKATEYRSPCSYFIPCSGSTAEPKAVKIPTRVARSGRAG